MSQAYYERYWVDQDALEDMPYKWPVIARNLPPDQPLRVLDFGSGKGTILALVEKLRPSFRLSGVDISPSALRVAKKRVPSGVFKTITANQKIPFPKNTFDLVLAFDVLEHILDTQIAFHELSRVLKPGGTVLITVPYNSRLKTAVAALVGFNEYFHPYSPHIRHFSPQTMARCLADSGLTSTDPQFFGRFFPLWRGFLIKAEKHARTKNERMTRFASIKWRQT